MLPRKFYSTSYTSVKINSNDIFFVPNFECPASWYCSAAEPYIITLMCRVMSKWCDMVMCVFKEWAVTEFLVVEKESVTHVHM